jgi:hypothetical protein
MHPGGAYKADVIVNGVIKENNSFFPSHWDLDTLISKISEACHNSVKLEPIKNGELMIIGKVSEGFNIKIKIDKYGKILTAYPMLR